MDYEIVTLEEKIAVGIAARTNNASPEMGQSSEDCGTAFTVRAFMRRYQTRKNQKALGIYTEYEGDEKSEYTVITACETNSVPQTGGYTVCKIPAGRYAKFVVHGDMVQAVAAAWQEIWRLDLPRTFQCDFEEYQDDNMENAEIHLYIGLTSD